MFTARIANFGSIPPALRLLNKVEWMNAVFVEAEFINIACGVYDDFVVGGIGANRF